MQAIKDAHILGFSYDGIIFDEGYEPRSAFGVIIEKNYILEVHDENDTIIPAIAASDFPLIEVFEMKAATEAVSFLNFFNGSTSLRKFIAPECRRAGGSYSAKTFQGCSELREIDLTNFAFFFNQRSGGEFGSCPKLIKFAIGKNYTRSFSDIMEWNPSDALYTNSKSLLTEEEKAEHPTWYNRDMLLYNIREYIAANLPDRTDKTPLTITFSQTLRNAFDQATEDAFAAKNWDIAPARS